SLLSAGLGCTLRKWSLRGVELGHLPFSPPGIAVASDRRLAFAPGAAYLALASGSGNARVHDTGTRKLVLSCANYAPDHSVPAFSPEGEVFAVTGVWRKKYAVKLWKVPTGQE